MKLLEGTIATMQRGELLLYRNEFDRATGQTVRVEARCFWPRAEAIWIRSATTRCSTPTMSRCPVGSPTTRRTCRWAATSTSHSRALGTARVSRAGLKPICPPVERLTTTVAGSLGVGPPSR